MLVLEGGYMKQHQLRAGDSLYLSCRKVIVCDMLYPFQLAIVCYENESQQFVVDQFALSESPAHTYSIPITLFKGVTI